MERPPRERERGRLVPFRLPDVSPRSREAVALKDHTLLDRQREWVEYLAATAELQAYLAVAIRARGPVLERRSSCLRLVSVS